jgi:hypothetical protein
MHRVPAAIRVATRRRQRCIISTCNFPPALSLAAIEKGEFVPAGELLASLREYG